jgi:hypothetical protein
MRRRTTAARSLILIGAVMSLFLAFTAGSAGAAEKRAQTAKLTVDVSAQRFAVEGDQVVARGPVVAQVQKSDGTTETLQQNVQLKVKPTHKCQILDLHLAKLYLNLLGLQVRTSDINVKLTGEPKQALGKLFCKLSDGLTLGKVGLAKRTAKSLNKALGDKSLPVLNMTVPIYPQEQPSSRVARGRGGNGGKGGNGGSGTGGSSVPPVPPGSCEVLNLFLGPLHLNLLGLVVDLYGPTANDPVQVLVTSDPNGGALGSTFCQLAGPYQG